MSKLRERAGIWLLLGGGALAVVLLAIGADGKFWALFLVVAALAGAAYLLDNSSST